MLTRLVDWHTLLAMIVGDIAGIVIVLSIAKGLFVLADRHEFPSQRFRR